MDLSPLEMSAQRTESETNQFKNSFVSAKLNAQKRHGRSVLFWLKQGKNKTETKWSGIKRVAALEHHHNCSRMAQCHRCRPRN